MKREIKDITIKIEIYKGRGN